MWTHSLPSSYKVVNLFQNEPILEERPIPKFSEEHCCMIIKPITVGICRSDIKEITGERVTRHDFGHEIVGQFVGANFPSPYAINSTVCFDPHVTIDRRTSGFGEYVFAVGPAENLIAAFPECPSSLEPYQAVFMEPLACVHHAISRLKASLDVKNLNSLNIGILGAGNAGTLMGLIAKHSGANVSLITRNQNRRSYLSERRIFDKDELLTETTPINMLDAVILATTWLDERVYYSGVDKLRDEGVLLLFGGTSPGKTMIDHAVNLDDVRRNQKEILCQYNNRNIHIAGTYGVNIQDIRASFSLLHLREEFPVERLIVDVVSLNDVSKLLLAFAANEKPFSGKYLVRI